MIFDRKLYREVIWSHDISLGLHNIYIFIHFFHWWIPRCRENQKRLGLFLCLWKLQKRFLHAKQTVSLVLCSFILASPLYCFLNSIKSRPFSLYREAFRLEPTLVISKETQWREISVHHSLLFHYTTTQLYYSTTHHRQTTDNWKQKTENPPFTTHYYSIILLHHYTKPTTHHRQTENWEQTTDNRQLRTHNRQLKTENWEPTTHHRQTTVNWQQTTHNCQQKTENWELTTQYQQKL